MGWSPGRTWTLSLEILYREPVPTAFQRSSSTMVHQARRATFSSESESNSAPATGSGREAYILREEARSMASESSGFLPRGGLASGPTLCALMASIVHVCSDTRVV